MAACPDADTVDLSRCWDQCTGPEDVAAALEAVAAGVELRQRGRRVRRAVLGACPALDDDCLHQLLALFPFLRCGAARCPASVITDADTLNSAALTYKEQLK